MQQPPIKDYALNNIVPGEANSREQETPTRGNFFYILEASHSRFSLQINDGPKMRGKLTRGHNFPADFEIEKIRIYNEDENGNNLSILLQVGKGTPIDNLFNVTTDDIVPILRSDTPSIITEVESVADTVGLNIWTKILDADEYRDEVRIYTDAVSLAYWGTSAAATEKALRNIPLRADNGGFVVLKTTSEIWVRHKEAGTVIQALVSKFA